MIYADVITNPNLIIDTMIVQHKEQYIAQTLKIIRNISYLREVNWLNDVVECIFNNPHHTSKWR